ncbi:MAG TPA: nucleotidyltransferase family protein [bacterium]|nr:nucleotidyltransferase family protein [bacterium]
MRAMLLAAGLGTRLRPLTEKTPKALLLVGGRPLIYYSLKLLQKHGIKEVVINLHYLGELIQQELGGGAKFGLHIHYSWEPRILGTGGGVKKASRYFDEKSFLVLNSDVLIDLDLKALHRFHKSKKAAATMAVREQSKETQFTPVWVGRNDRIVGIGGEAPEKPGIRPMMYTGVQYLEPSFIERLPDDHEACMIREGYQPAIADGQKIAGFPYSGYWNDLGTLDRLRQAEEDLRSGRIKLSFL